MVGLDTQQGCMFVSKTRNSVSINTKRYINIKIYILEEISFVFYVARLQCLDYVTSGTQHTNGYNPPSPHSATAHSGPGPPHYRGFNPLNPELYLICYLLALLGAHHFLHVSRIRVKLLILRRLMSYIYIWSTHS